MNATTPAASSTVTNIRADLEAITRRLGLHTAPDQLEALAADPAITRTLFDVFRACGELYAQAADLAGALADEYDAAGDPIGLAEADARQQIYQAEAGRYAVAREFFRRRR